MTDIQILNKKKSQWKTLLCAFSVRTRMDNVYWTWNDSDWYLTDFLLFYNVCSYYVVTKLYNVVRHADCENAFYDVHLVCRTESGRVTKSKCHNGIHRLCVSQIL